MTDTKIYQKKDALMTRGLAICSMLILHLFCREGADVYGTPLIWINKTTPLVYYFGFFAEICVALYSMCAGYAQRLMAENKKSSWVNNLRRVGRLMVNYWIVLCLFCAIGLIIGSGGGIPGSLTNFLKSIVLLHSYNGAWWYLNTYIILMLVPPVIALAPVEKLGWKIGLCACTALNVLWYFIGRFGMLPDVSSGGAVLAFTFKEAKNMMNVLPYFWMGAFLCKGKAFEKCASLVEKHIPKKRVNFYLLGILAVTFIANSVLRKAVLVTLTAPTVFLIFNLLRKSNMAEKIFLFLGKHSTNIWLTHMFFYTADPFDGLVQKARYPILMLGFMLALCIAASYVVMGIDFTLKRLPRLAKQYSKE